MLVPPKEELYALFSPILPGGGRWESRELDCSGLLSDYFRSSAVLICIFGMGQIIIIQFILNLSSLSNPIAQWKEVWGDCL